MPHKIFYNHEETFIVKKETISVRNSLLLLLTATIWGVAFVAQSVSMDYIGGFTFNAIRNLMGSVTLLPVIWVLGRTKSTRAKAEASRQSANLTHRRHLLWYSALPCKQFSAVWNQIYHRWKSRFYHCLLHHHCSHTRDLSEEKMQFLHLDRGDPFLCGLYLLCLTPGEGFAIGRGELLV